jgi:micrococcal nuclease
VPRRLDAVGRWEDGVVSIRALFARGPSLASLAVLVILVVVLVTGSGGGGGGEKRDASSSAEPADGVTVPVTRVVDGDTIEVRLDDRTEDVRYIGVDTPETVKPGSPVECFGHEASDFNERLVDGRTVRLEFDAEHRDVYGRLLAYVHAGDRFVNAELVRLGYATALTIVPNDRFAGMFARLEREAADAGRGLWGAC